MHGQILVSKGTFKLTFYGTKKHSPNHVSQRSASEKIRNDVIIEERPASTDWNQRILVNDDYKLVFYAGREYGELYDLRSDPDHIHNLWDSSSHSRLRQQMISRILSHEMNRAFPTPGPLQLARSSNSNT